MPYLNITSNLNLSDTEKNNALLTLSQAVAELLGKHEDYIMTSWTSAKMTMARSDSPTALIELRGLRLPEEAPEMLSRELPERLGLVVDIRVDRIFLNFIDVAPSHWGHNGKTFA